MAEPPKLCPHCRIEWGVERVEDAKPKDGDRPATPARYKCNACYWRWTPAE